MSAYMGAIGASLGTMVANLSAHKRGWDDRWEEFSAWAEKGQELMERLLHLVDEDTAAFNGMKSAMSLPKHTEEEKALRADAIERATLHAIKVPLETMNAMPAVFELCKAMATAGNPASVSGAGVGALAARAAMRGAALNVRINASSLADEEYKSKVLAEVAEKETLADRLEAEVIEAVENNLK